MNSKKNQLQEFWQAHGDRLPGYETKRVGGVDHKPLYQSTVTLPNREVYTGDSTKTRVAAEISAASEAIKHSSYAAAPQRQLPPQPVRYRHNTYVFVDLENIPQATSLVDWLGEANCIGFVSRKHPLATKQQRMPIIVVDSYQKDAADFAIAMHIAMFIQGGHMQNYKHLMILTKDHFGAAVRDIIQQWWAMDITHAASIKECLDHIK